MNNTNKEVTLVRKKEDFRNRGIKSGSINNFSVTEVLRNIFMEMNKTEKRIDKSICRRRKQRKGLTKVYAEEGNREKA